MRHFRHGRRCGRSCRTIRSRARAGQLDGCGVRAGDSNMDGLFHEKWGRRGACTPAQCKGSVARIQPGGKIPAAAIPRPSSTPALNKSAKLSGHYLSARPARGIICLDLSPDPNGAVQSQGVGSAARWCAAASPRVSAPPAHLPTATGMSPLLDRRALRVRRGFLPSSNRRDVRWPRRAPQKVDPRARRDEKATGAARWPS